MNFLRCFSWVIILKFSSNKISTSFLNQLINFLSTRGNKFKAVLNSMYVIYKFVVFFFYKFVEYVFAAAAKSLQLCPTLCDPIDGSPPGSSVPGILQARTLEWVAISFSNA